MKNFPLLLSIKTFSFLYNSVLFLVIHVAHYTVVGGVRISE